MTYKHSKSVEAFFKAGRLRIIIWIVSLWYLGKQDIEFSPRENIKQLKKKNHNYKRWLNGNSVYLNSFKKFTNVAKLYIQKPSKIRKTNKYEMDNFAKLVYKQGLHLVAGLKWEESWYEILAILLY